MLKFPYGISDFHTLMTENYFYVDRTSLLPEIEEAGKQLLFLRPRRFGKSLLLSMLENYYDVAKAEEFDKLFGHLAIGKQPTPKHNQYFVMKWDFSMIRATGEVASIQQALYNHINGCIEHFSQFYRDQLKTPIVCDPNDAVYSLQSLLTAVSQTPYRLYLLIDEYDNFANELMMGNHPVTDRRYQTLLYGEGALKTLFKVVKAASSGQGLDRVLMTGISPVVLSDLTNAYNIAKNIYFEEEFQDLCGFREDEIQAMLTQVVKDCGLSPDRVTDALNLMRTFYNGYCFRITEGPPNSLVYNPTMSLYFLEYFQKHCRYPRQMLDHNLAMDRAKLAYISQLPNGESLLWQALREESSVLIDQLSDRFGVEDMLNAVKDQTFIASLLYYFGVLTFNGDTPYGQLSLKIPNLVSRQLYAEQLRERLLPGLSEREEATRVARLVCQTGELQPLCQFTEQHCLNRLDNRDSPWANELTLKTAFLTLLSSQDVFYFVDSETVLSRQYADLTLLVRPDMRKYQLLDLLLEFKYLKLGDVNLSGQAVRELTGEALSQLKPVIEKRTQARTQLQTYRSTLQARYGEGLRLHSYSVVAIGFERLVCEAMD